MPRLRLGRVVTALLLVAVLSTATLIHLIWHRTATSNIEKIVETLDTQSLGAVRSELTATLSLVASTAEIVRSILFQGAIKADDEVKREFLFLSLLREQPSIAWIGYGFPDGRFFGSHALPDGKIEMLEIGAGGAGSKRPLRRDVYRPLPGDVFFERRIKGSTDYVSLGAAWYRQARDADAPVWTVVDVLPSGFEPAVVVSRRVEMFGRFEGVVMVAVSLSRLSRTLQALEMPEGTKAFVVGAGGRVLATSDPGATGSAARLADFPAHDTLAAATASAEHLRSAQQYRTQIARPDVGTVFVSSALLPFKEWRLLTAVPRSAFAGEIDRNTRRVLFVVAALVVVAAMTAVLFANLAFSRPLRRLASQLTNIERFELDRVRHVPTYLLELNDLSLALRHMAAGLSAFARYLPLDVVRPLVEAGAAPRPGGELTEITVFFADLPGFTELTEELGPGVEPHLTNFLTLAVAAIHSEGGTVDKFVGDAVMAFWNAPSSISDHAERACRAALAIRDAMHAIPAISQDRDEIRVRIGINTGIAIVGNVGSSERLSYTAIGDTVNLASRLVGVAKQHNVEIVASSMTLEATTAAIMSKPLGTQTVRGKAVPVMIHEITGSAKVS
ncbi:MAG: adenylate/guanylate cyclase domain-containing protein [Rhizobiaceae bacterium]